jgi:TP901 family phage tail tape measure protein
LPLLAISGAAIKMSTDFESAMTKVETIAGESQGNIGGLSQAILDLAPTVGIGPKQLADALLVVESTGIRGSAALEVLTASAKASAIGLGETKDIARAVTAAVTAYGAENLSAAQATDILYQTVVAGGAEADQLAGELGRVVGVAAQLGVSFDEVGAFIATYTRLGLSAAEATTGLSGVLNTILSPSKEAATVLGELGLSANELRQQVKERGLSEALVTLVGSLHGNADATGALFGNVRALAGVLGTAGTQAQSYRQTLEQIQTGTGTLNAAFERWRGTTAATWNEFTARVQIAAIALGTELAPAFSGILQAALPVLDVIVKMVQVFGSLPEPVQTGVIGLVALVAAIGPVTYAIGAVMRAGSAVAGLIRLLGFEAEAGGAAFASLGPAIAVVATAIGSLSLGRFISELQIGSLQIGQWVEFLAIWKFGLSDVSAETAKLALRATQLSNLQLPTLPGSPTAATAIPVMPIGIDKAFALLGQSASTAAPQVTGLSKELQRAHEEMLRTAIEAERAKTSFEFFQTHGAMPLQQALAGLGVQWNDLTEAIIPTSYGLTGVEPVMASLGREVIGLGGTYLPQLNVGLVETGQRFIQAKGAAQSFGDFLKNDLGKVILSAFTGGGDAGKSIGGAIGGFLTGPNGIIGRAVAGIGGTLGSVLGSVLPGLGTLLGGLAGSTIGRLFGNLFGGAERQINPIRQAFVDAAGGLDALNQRASTAGVTLRALLDARTPEQYRAAIEALNAAFTFQDQAMQTLDETVKRYGFTLEELGPALQRQSLSEQAAQLFQDFTVLNAAGIDSQAILTRMGDSVNAFVQQALRTGTEIPAAMRPMLEQFVASGQLFDQNGQQITDLGASGIVFSETMTQGFAKVVDSVNKLAEAIARGLGIALTTVTDQANAAAGAIGNIPRPPTGDMGDQGSGSGQWNPGGVDAASAYAGIWNPGTGNLYGPDGRVILPPPPHPPTPVMLTPGELAMSAATTTPSDSSTQMVGLLAEIRALLSEDRHVSVQVDGREIVKAEQRVLDDGGSLLSQHRAILGVT